ncbi:uncharacterized protein [Lolium perenne]|uniref:uncharacterized protein n=1 Tax=Lolium perenne TaxID=4522 RepID=UPI003A996D96
MDMAVLQQLHPRRTLPSISLYADDVIIFCHPSANDSMAIKKILSLFGHAFGLRINYAKSSATLIRCDQETAAPATQLLGCPIVQFPFSYLGIPLTIRRPTAAQLQPIVDSMANKLPTWKSRLMQKPGRLALVKSVLGAIPIHQLLVLALVKKTIKLMEKIGRGFLWEGRSTTNGGSCHVNWRRVCRPIPHGGLGIQDLHRTSLALRTRWQWLSRTDNNRAWSGLDLQFTTEETDFFFVSTSMTIGNGQTAKFWEDRWIGGRAVREIAPDLYACIPKRRRKTRTVADGLAGNHWAQDIHGIIGINELGQYLRLWQLIEHTQLTTGDDSLIWKWHNSGKPPQDDASLNEWWIVARQHTPKPMRKGLATITLMVPWMIWKHRNSCVFDGQQPSIRSLCATIKDKAAAWATAGAKGLRDVLPTTWDVH